MNTQEARTLKMSIKIRKVAFEVDLICETAIPMFKQVFKGFALFLLFYKELLYRIKVIQLCNVIRSIAIVILHRLVYINK